MFTCVFTCVRVYVQAEQRCKRQINGVSKIEMYTERERQREIDSERENDRERSRKKLIYEGKGGYIYSRYPRRLIGLYIYYPQI